MQAEVDGSCAVVDQVHTDALGLPVGQRVLVAGDVDVVGQMLAAEFYVYGACFLARICNEGLCAKHDIFIQGCRQAGHETGVMLIAGERLHGSDRVLSEARAVVEDSGDALPARFPLVAPISRPLFYFVCHRCVDETGSRAVFEAVSLNVCGQPVVVIGAVWRYGDVVVEQVIGNHGIKNKRCAQRVAYAESAPRRAIVLVDVWFQLVSDKLLQVGRVAIVVSFIEQSLVAVQWHGQVVVVAEVIDVEKVGRADANDNVTRAPAAVGVGLAGNVEQAVDEVEHSAVLCVEHVNDVVVSLVVLLIARRSVYEHLPLMAEILGLHRDFLYAFELRKCCKGERKGQQYGEECFLFHCYCRF